MAEKLLLVLVGMITVVLTYEYQERNSVLAFRRGQAASLVAYGRESAKDLSLLIAKGIVVSNRLVEIQMPKHDQRAASRHQGQVTLVAQRESLVADFDQFLVEWNTKRAQARLEIPYYFGSSSQIFHAWSAVEDAMGSYLVCISDASSQQLEVSVRSVLNLTPDITPCVHLGDRVLAQSEDLMREINFLSQSEVNRIMKLQGRRER